jgi:hypothetical protein
LIDELIGLDTFHYNACPHCGSKDFHKEFYNSVAVKLYPDGRRINTFDGDEPENDCPEEQYYVCDGLCGNMFGRYKKVQPATSLTDDIGLGTD